MFFTSTRMKHVSPNVRTDHDNIPRYATCQLREIDGRSVRRISGTPQPSGSSYKSAADGRPPFAGSRSRQRPPKPFRRRPIGVSVVRKKNRPHKPERLRLISKKIKQTRRGKKSRPESSGNQCQTFFSPIQINYNTIPCFYTEKKKRKLLCFLRLLRRPSTARDVKTHAPYLDGWLQF